MPLDSPFPLSSGARHLFDEIRAASPCPSLVPDGAGTHAATAVPKAIVDEIRKVSDEDLLGTAPLDPTMAAAVRAGLLLRADRLEKSHTISQGIDTPTGSYWHGIMHRREPDYGNSKYWFRRTGPHPLFQRLAEPDGSQREIEGTSYPDTGGLGEIVESGLWDPFSFVDLCEACARGSRPELREELELLQEREMKLLLAHCFEAATTR